MASLDADSSDEDIRKPSQLNADSSDDEVTVNRKASTALNADSSDEEVMMMSKSSHLNADSSDEEQGTPSKAVSEDANNSSDEQGKGKESTAVGSKLDSSDEEPSPKKGVKKKVKKRIVDSDDSDSENASKKSEIDNSSDDEDEEKKPSSQSQSKSKGRKIQKALASDDSDGETEKSSQPKAKANVLKNKDLYDAESSDDDLPDIPRHPKKAISGEESGNSDSHDSGDEESIAEIKNKAVEKAKRGGERKSAQAAMMEIRSESARLTRESAIGLPYHRPKQRSLEDFLNRKKGTPEVVKNIKLKKLDSNTDKLMEEREKRVKEFFKADSEDEQAADDEEDGDDKDFDPNTLGDENKKEEGDDSLFKSQTNFNDQESENLLDQPPNEAVGDSGISSGQVTSEESNQNSEEEKGKLNTKSLPLDLDAVVSDTQKTSEAPITQMTPEEPAKEMVPEEAEKSVVQEIEEDTDSFRLELEPDTETLQVDKDTKSSAEKEKMDNSSASLSDDTLRLVLEPDTEAIPASPQVTGSGKAVNKAWARLEALKKKIGDTSDLEKTLSTTPKISGSSDELIVLEPEAPKISAGAQKLFERFYKHATAGKSSPREEKKVENVKIVTKKIVDGKEILVEEVVEYKMDEKKEKKVVGTSYFGMKDKLKKEMMAKKLTEIKQRDEIIKMNNEEGFADELPEDEEMDEDEAVDDEEYDENEEDEEEDGESEPEEDDVPMKETKKKRNAYVDDEAEDEDEDDDSDDDNDSLALELPKKRSQFKKIIQDPELMSENENSNQSDIFARLDRIRGDAETPTLNRSVSKMTSAPSSDSMMTNIEPRWTPFQDRTGNQLEETRGTENTVSISPTQSQMAKKRLGFEELFDQTDPDVTDIDDVIGLCSGQFATQKQTQVVSERILTDISGVAPVPCSVETQDTVILTATGSASNTVINSQEEDTVILTNQEEPSKKTLNASINQILENIVDDEDTAGHGRIESEESGDDEENSHASLKVSKKRKGRLLSDSEESDAELDNSVDKEDADENTVEDDKEYDSEENEIVQPKKVVKQKLFDKKGKLRKDFYDEEAELSDEEGGRGEFSDDEDEKGLDRFEMEEGDLDEIDEEAEKEKVRRFDLASGGCILYLKC